MGVRIAGQKPRANAREITGVGLRDGEGRVVAGRLLSEAGTEGARRAAPGGPHVPVQCAAVKQATGERCTARPVKGDVLCVGHRRAADA